MNTKTLFMEILERIILFSFPCSRSHPGGFGDHQRHVPGEIWCYPKGCPELRVRRWLQAPPNRNTSLSHRQVEPITNNNCWKNHLTTLPENTYLGSPFCTREHIRSFLSLVQFRNWVRHHYNHMITAITLSYN